LQRIAEEEEFMRGRTWSALSREKEEAVLRSMVAEKRRNECFVLVEQ